MDSINATMAIFVAPGFDIRSKQVVGYDTRILIHWTLGRKGQEVAKKLAEIVATELNREVVGSGSYYSIRFNTLNEAKKVAERLFTILKQEYG